MPRMPSMEDIYRRHSTEYDRLVNAEDHAGRLPEFLRSRIDWRGLTVLEGGLGTGRVTELYAAQAGRIAGFDRESHMLEAARRRLTPHAEKIDLRPADNLNLPRLPEPADIFIEGWSWGHSILEAPGSVKSTAEALFANIRKNLIPGAPVILIETLGTNTLKPNAPHPRLAELDLLLQTRFGLARTVLSTDYRFPTVREAADTLGFFFGDAMKEAVQAAGSPVVPEWTGVWHGPLPPG